MRHFGKLIMASASVLAFATPVYAQSAEQRPDDNAAGEKPDQHDAGQHARHEHPEDRDFGGDRVDDHDDRRRYQQPERAGAAE